VLDNNRLDGKSSTVTGAGGEIGAAAIRLMAAHGARIVAVDRDAGALQPLPRIGGCALHPRRGIHDRRRFYCQLKSCADGINPTAKQLASRIGRKPSTAALGFAPHRWNNLLAWPRCRGLIARRRAKQTLGHVVLHDRPERKAEVRGLDVTGQDPTRREQIPRVDRAW